MGDDERERLLQQAAQQQQSPRPSMPPMEGVRNNLSHETREAMQEWEIAALRRELVELKETVDTLNADKEKAMRWGLVVLGTAVVGMATWIFNFIFSHIKS